MTFFNYHYFGSKKSLNDATRSSEGAPFISGEVKTCERSGGYTFASDLRIFRNIALLCFLMVTESQQ